MSYNLLWYKLNHASLLKCLKSVVYSGAGRYCTNVDLEGKSLKEHLHFIELQIKYHERLKKKVQAQEKRIDKLLVELNEQRNKLLIQQQQEQGKSK